MTILMFKKRALQVALFLHKFGPVKIAVCGIWLIGLASWLWLIPYLNHRDRMQSVALTLTKQNLQKISAKPTTFTRPVNEKKLEQFYDALGDTRYVEQQIKTLFSIASKAGVVFNIGEYKLTQNTDGRYQTYQVVLPMKGSYPAIRQFCETTLLTLPFASLDEVNFKRESISNRLLETKIKLTLYIVDRPKATGIDAL